MKLSPDDPKLTAYALGALSPEESAEVERALAESPDLRAEVEAIQNLSGKMATAFAAEEELGLSMQQTADLERAAASPAQPAPERNPWRWLIGAGATVCIVAIGIGVFAPTLAKSKYRAQRASLETTPSSSSAEQAGPAGSDLAIPPAQESPAIVLVVPAAQGAPVAQSPQPARRPAGTASAADSDPLAAPRSRMDYADADTELDGMDQAYKARYGAALKPLYVTQTPDSSGSSAGRYAKAYSVEPPSSESYASVPESRWLNPKASPLSTFSVDVDTASYSNVRRFLQSGALPPVDAVRIEELLNYFRYDYPQPKGSDPFSVNVEVGSAPWASEHRLVRIGLKAKDVSLEKRPRANLVFLVDVSGSMEQENKLPLVKRSLKLLVDQMGENDSIAMVTYAGNAGIALQPTSAANRDSIKRVIDRLEAGGSTHGSAGIQAAYELALQRFVKGGINRVMLCTDGDFNVGVTRDSDLLGLITEKAKSGVFLSVLGFGMGNLKDSKLELLADKGNGNYAYIDSFAEARRVFVEQMSGTLQTVAKDVKIQVEFSPAKVQAYRLIGYENRRLAAKDFNNDAKDAGEIGAGHAVTALYEIIPVGVPVAGETGETLRYQTDSSTEDPQDPLAPSKAVRGRVLTPSAQAELLFVKLRYKQPEADTSSLISLPVADSGKRLEQASADFRFAAAVAGFGMRLRNSPDAAKFPMSEVSKLAEQSLGTKADASRAEFVDLVRAAERLGR